DGGSRSVFPRPHREDVVGDVGGERRSASSGRGPGHAAISVRAGRSISLDPPDRRGRGGGMCGTLMRGAQAVRRGLTAARPSGQKSGRTETGPELLGPAELRNTRGGCASLPVRSVLGTWRAYRGERLGPPDVLRLDTDLFTDSGCRPRPR